MSGVFPDDGETSHAEATDAAGTSTLLRTTGRRAPDGTQAIWQNLGAEDRRIYLKWLVWVFSFYLALAGGLLFLLKHGGELKPFLIHPLTHHVRTNDVVGFAASLAVLVTFLMPTMLLLRLAAIVSNLLFVLYGYFGHIYPVLLLHLALLPINLSRVVARFDPLEMKTGNSGRAPSRFVDR